MAKDKMTPEEFEKWLESTIPKELHKLAKRNIKNYTVKTTQTAVDNCPIDTGYLAGSINYRMEDDGWTGVVFVGAEYGIYVEFGTVDQLPQPYFYPAYNKWADKYIAMMLKALGEAVD